LLVATLRDSRSKYLRDIPLESAMASYSAIHRKPVGAAGIPAALRPVQPDPQQHLRQPQHTHSRTSSSGLYPEVQSIVMSPTAATYSATTSYPSQNLGHSRRTASTATASSTSSQGGGGGVPGRMPSTVSISLRRSGSSRSGQSVNSSSYVALMRKQKATVWCDRAQHEDPRQAAQLKAAKQRATLEVVGGAGRLGGTAPSDKSSGGVRSKIRHHGAPKTVGYSPATLLVGAQGVPARLSASEVGDEDNSGDDDGDSGRHYNRTGSGRSSLVGQRYGNRPSGRLSTGSTPPSGPAGGGSPAEPSAENTKTPMPGAGPEHFPGEQGSKASGSSGEERRFGNAGPMEGPAAVRTESKGAEDLSRRGSVDERAMTMRGPRLYVANPDLSD
jgi:hypothetical protein